MEGDKCDLSVYMAPAMKLQRLLKFLAVTLKVDEGRLLLAHQGLLLDPNKNILANGLSSGSVIQCIQLQEAKGTGIIDSEETSQTSV